jgi:putative FmdB family regulatory protein
VPIREYRAVKRAEGCDYCVERFEVVQKANDPPLSRCPECGAPVRKLISAPSIGASRSGLDERAGNAGFHKLEKLGKGEYEAKY